MVKTVNCLFYYHSPTPPPFFFLILQNVDKALKNHYIIQNKISINKDRNTSKKQVYN